MTIQDDFERFDAENPHIFKLFCRYAREAANSGHRKYGAKMIIERVRWHVVVETRGDEFKINNNFTSRYVRKYLKENRHHEWLFNLRELRAP